MPSPKQRHYQLIYGVAVILVLAMLTLSLSTSRIDAVRRMERLAFTQVQLLEATLNNTLRETEGLLNVVAEFAGSTDQALDLLRRRMLFADQVANAGVYAGDSRLVGVLRGSEPLPPERLPESIRVRHHDEGARVHISTYPAADGAPRVWFTHSSDGGSTVVVLISERHLQREMQLTLGEGIAARFFMADGDCVLSWGADAEGWAAFLEENVGRAGRALHTEHRGNHIFALMQLRSYPLYVSLSFGPQLFLGPWHSRAATEVFLAALGLMVFGLLLRSAVTQQENLHLARERELLVRETNHRVKNNLTVIDSLLALGADSAGSEDLPEADLLLTLRGRIAAISLIHDALHRSEHLSEVPLQDYCMQLVQQVQAAYSVGVAEIHLSVPPLVIQADPAKRIGLILHELLANAFKYGYAAGGTGQSSVELTVEFRVEGDVWTLFVQDGGPGFPESPQARRGGSMGLSLVQATAKELGASVMQENSGGARVTVSGPVSALQSSTKT